MSTSSITYRIVNQQNLKASIKDAVDHRLYVKGWNLYDDYSDALTSIKNEDVWMVMAYIKKIPIGVVWIRNKKIAFYIKSKFRRQGIGTQLSKIILGLPDVRKQELMAIEGVRGSLKFFHTLKINHMNEYHECKTYMSITVG